MKHNHWISGGVRCGKTLELMQQLQSYCSDQRTQDPSFPVLGQSVLLFAMNAENRSPLTRRAVAMTAGQLSIRSATPLGFFEEEVTLFWPLIAAQLEISPAIPLRLRPEAEQYFAVDLWGEELARLNQIERFSIQRWARNLLDVLQLAAFAGVPMEDVPRRLQDYWVDVQVSEEDWEFLGQRLLLWRDWCLQHSFLTYGLVCDLYWRCLLPHPQYQDQLESRFRVIFADDVESYPAIARDFFEVCDRLGIKGCYTSHPAFSARLGLGADPAYLWGLRESLNCVQISLPENSLALGQSLISFLEVGLQAQAQSSDQSDQMEWMQTVTRSQLLRQVADTVTQWVKRDQIHPSDIAIIGPGLDSLARYALLEMIEAQGIPVISWKEQRPLNASALVRSLLTMLAFVYPGLGHSLDQDAVAEMMVVLTSSQPSIDPVRAGLLTDYCFKPDPVQPELLPLETFARWDRIGNEGAIAYDKLRTRIHQWRQPMQSEQWRVRPVEVLSQAIEYFWASQTFRFDQSAALRELLETVQHFDQTCPPHEALLALIQVVRWGTMTANPYPTDSQGLTPQGVVLASAYQYRIARFSHPYHFWLDISSPLWQQGNLMALWGASAFLRSPQKQTVSLQNSDDQLTRHLIEDISNRASQKIVLCHSDLSVTGQEQMGNFANFNT